MTDRTISIIIPTYNEEKFLPLCLDSISNLNYPKEDVEVIVVDNGSTDKTREIAEARGVKVYRDDLKNVSGLRNLGARQSKGRILVFLDADCLVSSEWLNRSALYFEDLNIIAWGGPHVPPKGAAWVQNTWLLIRKKKNPVQRVDWLGTINLVVRKEHFLAIDGFNESLVTCEDVDFSYRIGKYGSIISDVKMEVIHLRDPSTLRGFIRKEIWRGHGNLRGIQSHGLSLRELPSLSIPLYFGIFFPIFLFISIISFNSRWLIVTFLIYILPTLAVLYRLREKKIRVSDLVRVILLIQAYFFSRTIAVVVNPHKGRESMLSCK